MSPRALAAWSVSALTIALATNNPVYRAMVLVAALNVIVALRRSDARLRLLLTSLGVTTALSILLTLLLSHAGAHAFLTLPTVIPIVGGPLTVEALVFGAGTGLGIAAAVVAVAPLSLAIEPHELIDALPRVLTRSGAALATALNLIPGLGRSANEIREAQRMRGWRAGRVRDWPEVAVPVVLTAVENSLSLAEAMEARGYGSGARSHYRSTQRRSSDAAVAIVAVFAAALFIALRIVGTAVDWYPFPVVTVPTVDTLAVIACVALALPAVVWRR